jgi:hypothetical protein
MSVCEAMHGLTIVRKPGWNRRKAVAPPEPNHFSRGISGRRKTTTGMMLVMTLQLDMTDPVAS